MFILHEVVLCFRVAIFLLAVHLSVDNVAKKIYHLSYSVAIKPTKLAQNGKHNAPRKLDRNKQLWET